MIHRSDSLRQPDNCCEADPRQASFVILDKHHGSGQKTIEDQYRSASRLVLSMYVPEAIQIQFETTKNLYLYSWFVYRFYPVARLHAFTCLELALREKFGEAVILSREKGKRYQKKAMLWELLKYAMEARHIQNEYFDDWQWMAYVRAEQRKMFESLDDMARLDLDSITTDEIVEITDKDKDDKFINRLAKYLPEQRNTQAHGSTQLDNHAFHILKIVSEIINQIYRPGFKNTIQEKLSVKRNLNGFNSGCRRVRSTRCNFKGRQFSVLAEIVQDYIDVYAVEAERELFFYKQLKPLDMVIQMAAMARDEGNRKHPHQWRIAPAILNKWARRILLNKHEVRRSKSFDELFQLLAKLGKGIHGIGDLTVYDTAHRIGAKLGLSPAVVYLHSGVKSGAKALGLPAYKPYLILREIPQELHRLRPYQIEDCLCIYKSYFSVRMNI